MVRVNARFFDERELIKHVMREAIRSKHPRSYIERSGIMPLEDGDKEVRSVKTGRLLRNKNAMKTLLYHCDKKDEFEVAILIWNHPEKMKYSRFSPLGETYDMSNEHLKAKVENKKKKGILGYNEYIVKYNRKNYIVKTEVRKKGFEIPYHLVEESRAKKEK